MTRHILGVARTLPFHSIGGMQAIAWDLFREFARLGHTVTVITTHIPGKTGPFVAEGVQVIPLAGTRPERCDGGWWGASAQWFEQAVRDQRFDGVLSVSSAGAALAARRNLAPQAKFVFQAHGTSWGEFVSKWRSGRPLQWAKSARNFYWLFKDASIYRNFDHIALVGDVLQTQFQTAPVSWMLGSTGTALIRNGVDENVFRPDPASRQRERAALGWSADDRVAVFAARLHPQKGGEIALRAFHQLSAVLESARLLIIGGGEELVRLKALGVELGCDSKLHFTGAVARERVSQLMAAGDAFAFPTLAQEGLPMNVLEALACGLQPVCSAHTRTVFDPAFPITYENPRDISAFCEALRLALLKGAANSSLLSPGYSLTACARQYLDILLPQEVN